MWGTVPVDQLSNSTLRQQYVSDFLQRTKSTFTDGVNIDIEDPISSSSPEYHLLIQLMQVFYTSNQLHDVIR